LSHSDAIRGACAAEEIGVELTAGFMVEPEASVSALVFHHPDAAYFSVGVGEEPT
jgi:5-methyltetrahydrofolate--homocysteine methyltransferase